MPVGEHCAYAHAESPRYRKRAPAADVYAAPRVGNEMWSFASYPLLFFPRPGGGAVAWILRCPHTGMRTVPLKAVASPSIKGICFFGHIPLPSIVEFSLSSSSPRRNIGDERSSPADVFGGRWSGDGGRRAHGHPARQPEELLCPARLHGPDRRRLRRQRTGTVGGNSQSHVGGGAVITRTVVAVDSREVCTKSAEKTSVYGLCVCW